MSDIVESCPRNKLDGDIRRLRSAGDLAVQWLSRHLARVTHTTTAITSTEVSARKRRFVTLPD